MIIFCCWRSCWATELKGIFFFISHLNNLSKLETGPVSLCTKLYRYEQLRLFAIQLQHDFIFKFSSFFWRQKWHVAFCCKWLFRKTLCVFGVSHWDFIFFELLGVVSPASFLLVRRGKYPFLTWLIVNGKAGKELFI